MVSPPDDGTGQGLDRAVTGPFSQPPDVRAFARVDAVFRTHAGLRRAYLCQARHLSAHPAYTGEPSLAGCSVRRRNPYCSWAGVEDIPGTFHNTTLLPVVIILGPRSRISLFGAAAMSLRVAVSNHIFRRGLRHDLVCRSLCSSIMVASQLGIRRRYGAGSVEDKAPFRRLPNDIFAEPKQGGQSRQAHFALNRGIQKPWTNSLWLVPFGKG